ncbi:von Hippel-Lindau disease tumor suppressor-like [Branchiostoma lanceolatum]|uniref:von Hippel-Lindau disease tumor suppressor-like n=1 Tax=Branchiostoma lanceolatum TaxID=7740 RepID=UPI00345543D2
MPSNEGNQGNRDRKLVSGPSLVHSFTRFINKSDRCADIIWIDYEGKRVTYTTDLRPGEFFDVNTFVGHPWIFRDSLARDKLTVRCKEVYFPTPWNGDWPPQRTTINIGIPVYTLRERCLQVIRQLVPRSQYDLLEIPKTLKFELEEEDDEIIIS